MSTLQERIKERRTKLNYTLLEIAEALGVKEATVQRYESGEIKNIKHDTIVALAEILKCSPQYLMGWTEQINEIFVESQDNFSLTPHERKVIIAYRSHVIEQATIDKILDVEPEVEETKKQA